MQKTYKTQQKIVNVLLESIPFIRAFREEIIVIKYGGAAQLNPSLKENFALDLVLMYMVGIRPVVVHGGGKRIDEMLVSKSKLAEAFVTSGDDFLRRIAPEELERLVERMCQTDYGTAEYMCMESEANRLTDAGYSF